MSSETDSAGSTPTPESAVVMLPGAACLGDMPPETASAPRDEQQTDSIQARFKGHQDEIRRRSDLQSADTLNTDTFDHVQVDATHLSFTRPDQKYVVFSLSHVDIAPRAVDANSPAVCIYGVFATHDDATEHAQAVHTEHPNASVFIDRTHKWIVAPSSLERMLNHSAIDAHRDMLLRDLETKAEKDTQEFNDNVKHCRMGRTCASEAVDENIVAPKAKTASNRVSTRCDVRQQRLAVVSFVCDQASDIPEFMFYSYGCVDDESTADAWIRNVCGDSVKDKHIDVVSTCEWVFPQQMTHKTMSKEHFRSGELTHLMRHHRNQPAEVKRFYEAYGIDGDATDPIPKNGRTELLALEEKAPTTTGVPAEAPVAAASKALRETPGATLAQLDSAP